MVTCGLAPRPLALQQRIVYRIAKFMGPTWGPPGSCRPQMDLMLAPWTLLSGILFHHCEMGHVTPWSLLGLLSWWTITATHLEQVPIQMSYRDFTWLRGYQESTPKNGHKVTCPIFLLRQYTLFHALLTASFTLLWPPCQYLLTYDQQYYTTVHKVVGHPFSTRP